MGTKLVGDEIGDRQGKAQIREQREKKNAIVLEKETRRNCRLCGLRREKERKDSFPAFSVRVLGGVVKEDEL